MALLPNKAESGSSFGGAHVFMILSKLCLEASWTITSKIMSDEERVIEEMEGKNALSY